MAIFVTRVVANTMSATVLVVAVHVAAVHTQQGVRDPLPADTKWSLAAAGDAIITREVRCFENDSAFMALVKPLREADAAVINLEVNLFRLLDFKGYPQVENGGNYELGPPQAASDMKWMGFRLFNTANNHTTDYGVEGMLETMHLLDSLNLVYAGTGLTAGEAAQARYLETPKGRFALIGMATSFTPMSRAADPRPEVRGRPGLNALRIDHKTQLEPAHMADLRKLLVATGGKAPDSDTQPLRFEGATFLPGSETKELFTTNAQDEDRILRAIRSAARQADHVVIYSHSHDIAGLSETTPAPAHLREFIRKCLDAGGNAFVISGPHVLRGVEIYKGKPIFYSLGDFFMQNETIEPVPGQMFEDVGLGPNASAGDYYDARAKPDPKTGYPTAYHAANPAVWESVVPVAVFAGKTVVEIKFYPVDMGFRLPRAHQGLPRLADAALGRTILERLIKMSEIYGTRIVIKDGIGVWQPSPATTE